jgi:hypothetical protein
LATVQDGCRIDAEVSHSGQRLFDVDLVRAVIPAEAPSNE